MSTDQVTVTAGVREAFALDRFWDRHWARIIDNQPPPVRDHLQAERALVGRQLDAAPYRTVVEAGCADGTLLLPEVVGRGLVYLGLDLASGAVREARNRLASAGVPPAGSRVVRADVQHLPSLVAAGPPLVAPALVAFPFNVFGNLDVPPAALTAAAQVQADVIVLTYDTSEAASTLRTEYYVACGFRAPLVVDRAGVHLRTGGFRSSVYEPAVVVGWLQAAGFQATVHRYGAVGLAYHGRLAGPPTGPGPPG